MAGSMRTYLGCFGVWEYRGLGFRVRGLGAEVHGVSGLGFGLGPSLGVEGLGLRGWFLSLFWGVGLRV